MKELNLFHFHLTDMEIKHLEMIHESLKDTTETFMRMIDDKDFAFDLESAKEIFALYAMEVNRNAHQVDKVIDALKENADTVLNDDNGLRGNDRIKRMNNAELAKQYAIFGC